MKTLQELIHDRDFAILIPLAGSEVFLAEKINEVVKNEMGFLDYWYGILRNEDASLQANIMGGSINFVMELINNENANAATVEMLTRVKHPQLSEYARVKLSVIANHENIF